MTVNQSEQIAQTYAWLRAMSGGKLTQDQVNAGDVIITTNGLIVFAKLIGFNLQTSNVVTGLKDISERGLEVIREFEGFRENAYLDTGGVWTIGFGTIKYPNGTKVKKGDSCTRAQAETWLKNDTAWVGACLDRTIKVTVNQNQFDALASFIYNVGETAFMKSTMLKALNAGNYAGAASQFDRWVYDNGKAINGLVNRRAKEKALFLS